MVPRSAEQYVLPARSTVFPSDWSRKRPAIAAREVAQKGGLEPLFRSQGRTRVEGLDVLDRNDGPVIFAANHASHLDTPLIRCRCPTVAARARGGGGGGRLLLRHLVARGLLVAAVQHLPDRPPRRAMATTPGEVLADGWSLVIFPEGTRSRTAGWASSGWAPRSSPTSTACRWCLSRTAGPSRRCRAPAGRAPAAGR